MSKIIKKILKISTLVILFIVLPAFALLAIYNSHVQTKLTQYITTNLSERINSNISFSKIEIDFFNNANIYDLYIEDPEKDTLLYVKHLDIDFNEVNLKGNIIKIDDVIFNNSVVNIKTLKNVRTNTYKISDSFKSDSTTTESDTTKSEWDFSIGKVVFVNSVVRYIDTRDTIPDKEFGVDYTNIEIKNLNMELSSYHNENNTIGFDVERMEFKERSGFMARNLSAEVILAPGKITLNNLIIHSNKTFIHANSYSMSYSDFIEDFQDYNNNVLMRLNLHEDNLINFTDISYFAPSLQGMDFDIVLHGNYSGMVSSLRGKKALLKFGDTTLVDFNFRMNGLPDIENTYFDFSFKNLTTTKKDIETIPDYPFTKGTTLKLKNTFDKFGVMKYSGSFCGLINDFVTYGVFYSDLGVIESDILTRSIGTDTLVSFSGNISSEKFLIGELAGSKDIKHITASASVDGIIMKERKFNAQVRGKAPSVYVYGYEYNDLDLNCEVSNNHFDGSIGINDDNLELELTGIYDGNREMPSYNFALNIDNANLKTLNLIKNYEECEFSGLFDINFNGTSLDNLQGRVDVMYGEFKNENGNFNLDELKIVVDKTKDPVFIRARSGLFDVDITGYYWLSNLGTGLGSTIRNYIPSYFKDSLNRRFKDNYFSFDIDLKKSENMIKVLYPKLRIKDGAKISGNIDTRKHIFNFNTNVDTLQFNNFVFSGLKISTNTIDSTTILSSIQTDNLKFGQKNIDSLIIKLNTHTDSINVHTEWGGKSNSSYSGNIKNIVTLDKEHKGKLNIVQLPSSFSVNNNIWEIVESKLSVDSTAINIHKFYANNVEQSIYIDGNITDIPTDSAYFEIKNINTDLLNLFVGESTKFNGRASGFAYINNVYNDLFFSSVFNINEFTLNKVPLGNISIQSIWDKHNKAVKLDINSSDNKNKKMFHMFGNYYIKSKDIDFKLNLKHLNTSLIESFLPEYISETNGSIRGVFDVTGKLSNPLLNGNPHIETYTKVELTKCKYYANDYFEVKNNNFIFKKLKLKDSNNNPAYINGTFNHDLFENIVLDLNIEAQNFMVLNTYPKDNTSYYGKAFGSGVVNFSGPTEDINIDISIKTEKNTTFNVSLLSDEDELSDYTNYHFNTIATYKDFGKMNKTEKIKEEAEPETYSGMNLNLDLEITPDAEVTIFLGGNEDVITGKGNGDLRIITDESSKLAMIGDYNIIQGEYDFQMLKFINKNFKVSNGSYIRWSGDPFEADINIGAYYPIKSVSMHTLMSGVTNDNSYKGKKKDINCHILMKDKLSAPKVDFKIEAVNNSDEGIESRLKNLTEDEIGKQFVYLLFSRKFSLEEATGEQDALLNPNVTAGEFLTSQLSSILSQTDLLDVNLDFGSGDESSLNAEDIEVQLSSRFLNDRLIISVSGRSTNTTNSATEETSNKLVGDFEIEYLLTANGKIRMRAYRKQNDELINNSQYTEGLGITYREDFDSWEDLVKSVKDQIRNVFFKNKSKDKKKVISKSN